MYTSSALTEGNPTGCGFNEIEDPPCRERERKRELGEFQEIPSVRAAKMLSIRTHQLWIPPQ